MLRIVTPRRLAVAAFVSSLVFAGQARAQSAQSYGSPQGAFPSAQVAYEAAPAIGCGEAVGHGCLKLPKFHLPRLGHTVCRVPAGTICEPVCDTGCGFKMPKFCLPKIHMPKICLPKVRMPKLCHKKACDTGCGCDGWAAPAVYPSAQDWASPQGVASPQS